MSGQKQNDYLVLSSGKLKHFVHLSRYYRQPGSSEANATREEKIKTNLFLHSRTLHVLFLENSQHTLYQELMLNPSLLFLYI